MSSKRPRPSGLKVVRNHRGELMRLEMPRTTSKHGQKPGGEPAIGGALGGVGDDGRRKAKQIKSEI